MQSILVLLCLAPFVQAVSPIQKVVELLDECKAKVQKDLDAETKAMEEYTTFCDDELKDKGYAIETAGRAIADLTATVEASTANIGELSDEIATLGTTGAAKSKELADATKVRAAGNADFEAAEKELVKSIDELSRAATVLKRGMSFAQTAQGKKKISAAVDALKNIINAAWVDVSSKHKLKSFLQAAAQEKEDADDDLSFTQPQAKMVAYESSSGSIVKTVEEMQGKAEDTLSDLRKKEASDVQTFAMLEQGLKDEISHGEEKLSTATKGKAANEQAKEDATGKLVETEKSKAADEEYAGTLKTECEAAASGWETRQKSAAEEMGAIDKAKEILVSGVTAFAQVKTQTRRWNPDDDDESDAVAAKRTKVVTLLKQLGQKSHSFAFAQLANMASSDPFVKIRGLIEDMIAKLLKEAEEEATQKAFCDAEMGKSKKSQDEKTMTLDKLSARIDGASTTIAENTEAIKTLESEVAEIDAAQAEATKIRTTENADYMQASKDFKDSAEAVAKAIEVLKNFYEGSFIQLSATTNLKSKQPEFGGAKSDIAHTIISVLEMSEEDFTTLLAETEATEDEAAKAYKKLTDENKVSKVTKETEAKGKASEVKSLTVQLGHSKEDHASTSSELDAVNSYIDKLRPQCEEKAMSYEEKKARREAEIAGLKEALEILAGDGLALVQTKHNLRQIKRV
jgi:chromosome segregation ATPase